MAPDTTTSGATVAASRPAARRAFTLVELLVVTVIIMMLGSLTLSGLAVVRQRARVSATRSTIRKLHEIVVPHYESYLRRRVPAVVTGTVPPTIAVSPTNAFTIYFNSTTGQFHGPRFPNGNWPGGASPSTILLARSRLQILRTLQIFEMPDSWGDVATTASQVLTGSFCPAYARTGPVVSYAVFRQSLATGTTTVANSNGAAECLHLFVSRGGLEPDVMEQFRRDEIGDTDSDGAPEFLDAWRQPIQFIRWAPGVSITGSGTPFTAGFPRPSPIQVADANRYHDPLDPARVDLPPSGFALTPLIFSEGPDRVPNSVFINPAGWAANLVGTNTLLTIVTGNSNGTVGSGGTAAVRDNIFNHDLSGR